MLPTVPTTDRKAPPPSEAAIPTTDRKGPPPAVAKRSSATARPPPCCAATDDVEQIQQNLDAVDLKIAGLRRDGKPKTGPPTKPRRAASPVEEVPSAPLQNGETELQRTFRMRKLSNASMMSNGTPSPAKAAKAAKAACQKKAPVALPKQKAATFKAAATSVVACVRMANTNAADEAKVKGWSPPSQSKCGCCTKTVYAMEKLEADGSVYHKACFKCSQCTKTVGLGSYASLGGKIYCKPHFKQLFKLKGNYDEGFGSTQHKMKWVRSDSQDSNQDESEA